MCWHNNVDIWFNGAYFSSHETSQNMNKIVQTTTRLLHKAAEKRANKVSDKLLIVNYYKLYIEIKGKGTIFFLPLCHIGIWGKSK